MGVQHGMPAEIYMRPAMEQPWNCHGTAKEVLLSIPAVKSVYSILFLVDVASCLPLLDVCLWF